MQGYEANELMNDCAYNENGSTADNIMINMISGIENEPIDEEEGVDMDEILNTYLFNVVDLKKIKGNTNFLNISLKVTSSETKQVGKVEYAQFKNPNIEYTLQRFGAKGSEESSSEDEKDIKKTFNQENKFENPHFNPL